MITRRNFFGLLGGFAAAEAARKIYVLPPAGGWQGGGLITPGEALFFLQPEVYRYRYAYRNIFTGHVSNAVPEIARLVHTFAFPERDVIDIYRQMEDGSFDWAKTLTGYGR